MFNSSYFDCVAGDGKSRSPGAHNGLGGEGMKAMKLKEE